MAEHYFEVDVPMRSTESPGLRGVHVFTGRADSGTAAIKAAHGVYDAARAAAEAGREIPHGGSDGWGACGYRPGWELTWPAAKAGPWKSPSSWPTHQPFEL
ncbi:hypothetical protein KPP03845_200071 (plasmid) [Streptomyces xanthophaeus]|uniref:hypothetical protein n=1 Tax=Streptomyces xanthophaeus TaxID=67385 RepID=UPI00233F4A95|nr:hypothetical protein [Streptomyces xanthophaeus]WCD91110.1 hypothetical protein KPP03845_200071 [Streptomyces xanthophaeus]